MSFAFPSCRNAATSAAVRMLITKSEEDDIALHLLLPAHRVRLGRAHVAGEYTCAAVSIV